MRIIISCILFLVVVLFSNCSRCKKVPCPAFSNTFFPVWFPYTANQKLIFSNGTAKDTVTIQSAEKSNPYDATTDCEDEDQGCTTSSAVRSVEKRGDTAKFFAEYLSQTRFESNYMTELIEFRFYDFNFIAPRINDQGVQDLASPYTIAYVPTVTIGSSTFNDVQILRKDTAGVTNYNGPYLIFLSKNVGMVAYQTFPDLKFWIRQ